MQVKTWGFASILRAKTSAPNPLPQPQLPAEGGSANAGHSADVQVPLTSNTEASTGQEADQPHCQHAQDEHSPREGWRGQEQPVVAKPSQLLSLRDKLVSSLTHKCASERREGAGRSSKGRTQRENDAMGAALDCAAASLWEAQVPACRADFQTPIAHTKQRLCIATSSPQWRSVSADEGHHRSQSGPHMVVSISCCHANNYHRSRY